MFSRGATNRTAVKRRGLGLLAACFFAAWCPAGSASALQAEVTPRFSVPGNVLVCRAGGLVPTGMVLKGFGQTAPFYYSRSEGDWVALLAVPLTADQGTAPLEIDWSKGSHALSVVVGPDPYPATRSLKVRGLRRRLARAETSGDSVLLRRREEGDAPEPLWTGRFRWPLDGTITVTSPFGARREYNNGQAAWRHQGVDLRAAAGSPVRSANSGRVVLVRRSMALTGGTVVVDHGYGLVSCYFHLSTIGVRRGQYVRKGEALGMSGSSGLSNGPHLHFEMRLHGVAVSPLQWVGNPDERAANLSAPRAKAS